MARTIRMGWNGIPRGPEVPGLYFTFPVAENVLDKCLASSYNTVKQVIMIRAITGFFVFAAAQAFLMFQMPVPAGCL